MSEDGESLVGQWRESADGLGRIKVLGCYGYGSGGALYAVTLENSKSLAPSPSGLSAEDIAVQYPKIVAF